MTDKEKASEVNGIILNLLEKYTLDDIKVILTAARFKVTAMMNCSSCLLEVKQHAMEHTPKIKQEGG